MTEAKRLIDILEAYKYADDISDPRTQIWYHGRSVKSKVFDYRYAGGENAVNQEGSGFYFSNHFNDALSYAYPNGIIMRCKVNYSKPRLLTDKSPIRKNVVRDLIKKAPDLEMSLSNWDYDPARALVKAVNSIVDYSDDGADAYQQVEYDFYRYEPQEYLKNLSKYFDAHITRRSDTGYHLIVYNPKVIKVLEVFDHD
jgi:hypothetical protein